jgi:hypothetical protein
MSVAEIEITQESFRLNESANWYQWLVSLPIAAPSQIRYSDRTPEFVMGNARQERQW